MASNETQTPEDFDDVDLSGHDEDEVQTPTSGRKEKRKERETGDEGDGGRRNGADGSSLTVYKVSDLVIREATIEMLILVSRRTAAREIVLLYVKKKAAMKKILGKNKQRLSLTTDIWVSNNTGESYMVITAHFVDSDWQLKKMIIGFKHVTDHKGATICKVLLECLDEWGIRRVFCITVDNATANSSALTKFKKAMKLIGDDALVLKGEYMHLRCAAHILNLVVKEGMHEVNSSVVGICNGVQYVRTTTNRLKSFDLRCDARRIKRGSLPLDVKTRCNPTYLMLEQAVQFRVAFEEMEAEDKPYNDYFEEKVDGTKRIGPPMADDWDAADRLIQILAIFYNSTMVLSGSTYVTSHKLYSEIVNIARNLTALNTEKKFDEELKKKALAMLGKVKKYWDPFGDQVEMNKLVMVASVFDPRKKMKFAELCFAKMYGTGSIEPTLLSESVIQILKDLYDEYSRASLLSKNGGSNSMASSQSQRACSQSQEQVETVVGNFLILADIENLFDDIVKETGIEYDVLSWWKLNSGKFPVLSLIAKDIFAMQVTSVASESAFSTSGRVLDPFRSCLTHYMIEVLICTEQWLKSEIPINERGVSTIKELLADQVNEDELLRDPSSILPGNKNTFVWEVCQLGLGPIGLPGSQKCRRPDYPLALVGTRKAFQIRIRQCGGPILLGSGEVHSVAHRCVPTEADRISRYGLSKKNLVTVRLRGEVRL
ncbi:Ribonuclease H-like superfamily [Arabidopsis thaliana x Arabidopsis arenosa]|uniref:Ribonuclease H-like superfamily n=1 Tax=Arabidopsis thaliana x Arabidopsis arenosa TaxID=1240361 RepID=A0A8T1Z1P1_9BRAS|nr:Ribonuclease H-like superfamily [Arabidopsis thaliana x Arabidopsis arenosa]